MNKSLLFTIFILFGFISVCQKIPTKTKVFTCNQVFSGNDLDSILLAGAVDKIILKCSPKGSGRFQEAASGKKKDKNYFEKEHNIVWIKFTAKSSGKLAFRIRPLSENDDYDFLLFKVDEKFSNQNVKTKKINPIRTNISRNNIENKGITGLNFTTGYTHTVSGINSNFSKVISVIKGEDYILAIDDVYRKGTGSIIYFDYYLTKKISGIIVNEDKSEFLNAEISWNDAETGETLATSETDSSTGLFEIEVPYMENKPKQKYIMGTYSHGYFFKEKEFAVEEVKNHEPLPLNILLPKLKKGLRNPLQNMNFHGNLPTFLPSAYPGLKNLKKLMKRNKTLEILIEGHTNGCTDLTQELSDNRALAVKSYLVENGIDEKRMKTVGLNCKHMLYPVPKNETEASLNRRVEILITKY